MSIEAISYYLDKSDQDGRRLLALISLADWANHEGECYPGMETLAKRLRRTVRTAQKIVSELEEAGELLVVPGMGVPGQGGNTSRYYLLAYRKHINVPVPPSLIRLANERRSSDKNNGEKRGEGFDEGVKVSTRRGEGFDAEGVKVSSPKPSVEPSVEPSYISSASAEGPTEQQQWFAAICNAVGWDYHILGAKEKGQVAQLIGILRKGGYTLARVEAFPSWWKKNDWRGQKGQLPTLSQFRQELSKVPAPAAPRQDLNIVQRPWS